MTADLLFEIGTEELPSWYVPQAREAITALMTAKLAALRLAHGPVTGYATPRRIAVLVEDLAAQSEVRVELRRGPPKQAAVDAQGAWTQAALGFARSQGVEVSALNVEAGERGEYVVARKTVGGEAARTLLPSALQQIVEEFPAPRKMRWGDGEVAFLRPIAWLLARLGDEVLPLAIAGVKAVGHSYGHRLLSPGPVAIPTPRGYRQALADAYVIADSTARLERVWDEVTRVAAEAGFTPLRDTALLEDVTGLVEYPVAVLGRFDPTYLDLPEAVLTTTMIHHQRFFPLRDAGGNLAAAFVGVANNRVPDAGIVRKGYEQVLAGRLADARFFWESDRQKSLSQLAWSLSGIAFHKDLGTMADKVARVGAIAPKLATLVGLSPAEHEALARATPVFRADLATQMVYELPELEGVMGKAYALAEGYPPAVAQILEDGVRPTGPSGPLPVSPAGAVLAVADRLDKLLGFLALGKRPSGSADPFGLRRDAIALARILTAQGWPTPLRDLLTAAAESYGGSKIPVSEATLEEAEQFIWDRVVGLLGEEGIRIEAIRAAVADRPPVITAARRAHLLTALSHEAEFAALMTLYKRAANLAKEADDTPLDPGRLAADYEAPLYAALTPAREGVAALLQTATAALAPWDLGRGPSGHLEGLEAAIGQVLLLKPPLDAFLDHVLVMVDDAAVRRRRLALLREVRNTLRALGALEHLAGV